MYCQVNSAFGMGWLASSEVIIQLYSAPSIEQCVKLFNIIHFSILLSIWQSSFWCYFFNLGGIYQNNIIHLGVGKSGGHFPPRSAAEQLSTSIHLGLSE